MNIQKVEDSGGQPLAYARHQQQQMLSVPDVGAPRSNPLSMIWRRKGILAAVVIACVLAAMVKYMFSTQIFRSEARIVVNTSGMKSVDGDAAAGANAAQANLKTQVGLIKSSAILANVLAKEEVQHTQTMRDTRSQYTYIMNNLGATVGKDDNIITLTFDSPYPKEAQAILQAVIDSYAGHHTKESRAAVFKFEQYKADKKLELAAKQKELLDFIEANGQLSFAGGDKTNAVTQRLTTLLDALGQADLDLINAKSAYDSAVGKLNDPTKLRNMVEYLRSTGMSISTDSNEMALRGQLMAMEAQAEELNRRFLPDHPSVRASQATIASLRARIGEMDRNLADTYLVAMEQKVNAAKNRKAQLQASYDEQNQLAMAQNKLAGHYKIIADDVKRLADAVDNADAQIGKLRATESVGVPVVQEFDKPSNAEGNVVRPDQRMLLFQGLLIGLVLGCVAALVRDYTDQGLRSGEEITETLGVSLLGSVPHMAGPPNPMAQGRKVDLEPASDVAETYRTIRTAVFFGTPDRESRTILVTSPAPGDGKSTFTSNLAIAMAQTGKRVLLVDCDFRRPVQHRIFECRPGVGLSSVLAGHESLDKAIQNTGIAGLDILPAGPVPSNPSEILNSQSFNEVLEELSVRYEHVVIDSPPVMAVADSRILAAMCSVTILVLRAESTTRKAALHTRRALQSVGAAILGVVVNDVPRARDRYGDYGGYSGYRAKYNNAAHANGASEQTNGGGAGKSTAMVPARSFLDLRRK
jgi:polysaccharide biosynthesis transport protein